MAKVMKKHYSEIEKRFFLELLKEQGPIIEQKKSDASSMSAKEEAWENICKKYNTSHLISAKRTVHQLKKLWSNLKCSQRSLLTRERQATMATGGGPPPSPVEIDPDVAQVAPHLLISAPTLFSSNTNEEMVHERRDVMFGINTPAIEDMLDSVEEGCAGTQMSQPADTLPDVQIIASGSVGRRSRKCSTNSEINDLKMERMKAIIESEKRLAMLNYEHERTKNEKELEFLNQKYALELRRLLAEAKFAENQLKNS